MAPCSSLLRSRHKLPLVKVDAMGTVALPSSQHCHCSTVPFPDGDLKGAQWTSPLANLLQGKIPLPPWLSDLSE